MLNKTRKNKMSLQVKLILAFLLVSVGMGIVFTGLTTRVLASSLAESGLDKQIINTIGREFVIMTSLSAILAAVISVAIAFVLADGIMKPLRNLIDAMGKVTNGDYTAKADINLQDELGDLARSFNKMTEQLSGKSIHIDRLNEEISKAQKIERDLRCAKERFTSLFENIKSGVAVYKPVEDGEDFVIIDFNKAAERIEKISRNEVIGKRVTEVFPGCRDFGILNVLQDVSKTGKPEYCEPAWYQDEGDSGWRENYIYKLSTGHLVAVYDDVTEQKEYEQALIEGEKELRTYVEKAPIGIFITDTEGNYIDINPDAYNKLGYSKKQILDKNVRDICCQEERDSVGYFIEELRTKGAGSRELKLKKRDGDVLDIFVRAAMLSDEKIIGFCVDITERKQYERKIEQQQKLLSNIVSNIPYQVFWKDRNFVYCGCNQNFAKDRGFEKPEDVIGKDDYQLKWGEGLADKYRKIDRQIIKDGKSFYEMEEKLENEDGSNRYILKSKVPLKNPEGKITGIVGLYTDITERKAQEQVRKELNRQLQVTIDKLRSSNKQLQEFTYLASHDLREPARKISAFGELLAESLAGNLDDDQYENLCFMIDGAEQMQQMVEGLLAYSRVTTKELKFEKVDLNNLIEQVRGDDLYEKLECSGGKVSVPKDLPQVSGDAFQLKLLLRHLIDNAVKFHKKDQTPKIVVKSYDEGSDKVKIEIADNGIGINPRYHNQIFDMFKRLHPKEEYDGIGMGLAICRKIIERHDGQVGVKSDENKGASFWLTLNKAEIKGNNAVNDLESYEVLK